MQYIYLKKYLEKCEIYHKLLIAMSYLVFYLFTYSMFIYSFIVFKHKKDTEVEAIDVLYNVV